MKNSLSVPHHTSLPAQVLKSPVSVGVNGDSGSGGRGQRVVY